MSRPKSYIHRKDTPIDETVQKSDLVCRTESIRLRTSGGLHMRKRLAVAALLLALGFSAYEAFTHKTHVQVTDDGTPPPPSFP
jgi:hypothetical protein